MIAVVRLKQIDAWSDACLVIYAANAYGLEWSFFLLCIFDMVRIEAAWSVSHGLILHQCHIKQLSFAAADFNL